MSSEQSVARRLYVLDFGLFQVHENGRIIGIPGYLVETGEKKILVDTGFPPWYRADPVAAALEDGLGEFGRILKLEAEHFPDAQLEKIGLRPKHITHLVMTHGDIDHVGFIHQFAHATIVMGAEEHASGPPRYFGGNSRMDWPGDATYQLISEDTELASGVSVLPTPGHSIGHVSLQLRLATTGVVVLAGDAINRAEELETGLNSGGSDQAAALASTRRLVELTRAHNAMLIYGHDPDQWPTLRKAPEFYD